MVVLSRTWSFLILVKCLPNVLREGVGRKRAVFGACECWIVRAWSWEFFLEGLGVVHKGVALGESCGVLRRLIFVLGVDLVVSWCWKFGNFLSNKVIGSLSAGKSLLFAVVLLHKARLCVKGRPRRDLTLHEFVLACIFADFASRVRH